MHKSSSTEKVGVLCVLDGKYQVSDVMVVHAILHVLSMKKLLYFLDCLTGLELFHPKIIRAVLDSSYFQYLCVLFVYLS